jgi:transposase
VRAGAWLLDVPSAAPCGLYDQGPQRAWRHLDTMQFETVLQARVPRVHCPQHGVKNVEVPWAGKHSPFTWLFEAFALRVLEASTTVKAAAPPQARVVHDKFHVSKHLNEAVDEVRRSEQRQLCAEGQDPLTGTKYLWLRNPEDWNPLQQTRFAELRHCGLKVAKAWQIKELFREFSLDFQAIDLRHADVKDGAPKTSVKEPGGIRLRSRLRSLRGHGTLWPCTSAPSSSTLPQGLMPRCNG